MGIEHRLHTPTLRGAPDPATLEWRQRMAEEAVRRAQRLDEEGRHLLLAGDPVAPGEVIATPPSPTGCAST